MKHVPSLLSEPPELASHIARNATDAEAPGSDAQAVWQRFKDSDAYSEVLARLVERQMGLCGYCEQRLTTRAGTLIPAEYQIEHVKAKATGNGLTLEWTNLMLCCGGGCYPHHRDPTRFRRGARGRPDLSCGQAKGDKELDANCDPRTWPCQSRMVEVDLSGRIRSDRAECGKAGIDPDLLQRTIDDVLRLNTERLRLARQAVAANVVEWVVDILEELQHIAPNLPRTNAERIREELVGGRLGPDEHGHLLPFWSTERQFLPEAEAWVARNAALLGC